MRWRVLDKLLGCADNFYSELKKRKAAPEGPSRKAGKIRRVRPLVLWLPQSATLGR